MATCLRRISRSPGHQQYPNYILSFYKYEQISSYFKKCGYIHLENVVYNVLLLFLNRSQVKKTPEYQLCSDFYLYPITFSNGFWAPCFHYSTGEPTNGPISPQLGVFRKTKIIFTLTTAAECAVRGDAYRLRWCWRPPPSRWCHCALMSPWSPQWSPPSSSSQLLNWPGTGFPWRLLIPQHLMETG